MTSDMQASGDLPVYVSEIWTERNYFVCNRLRAHAREDSILITAPQPQETVYEIFAASAPNYRIDSRTWKDGLRTGHPSGLSSEPQLE